MDTLHPQAALLLAYVDKQLSPDEIIEAETLLAKDPEAVSFVKALGVSQLPFAESFEFLLEDSHQDIENLVPASSTDLPSEKTKAWQWPVSLAASLLMGLVIGYGVFSGNAGLKETNKQWITDVANYQLLYVRETVTAAPLLNDKQQLALQDELSQALEGDLIIPDLSDKNLTFRRGQLLDIAGKPLVQMVYLPDNGLPVALCVLRDGAEDALPKLGEYRKMSYVEWSKNGLSFVLIGKMDQKHLESVAMSAMDQLTI